MILTTNTPYPLRKIRRIRACTHQRPQRNEAQYAVSEETQYAVFKIYYVNILEDIKRGPYSKKPQYARSSTSLFLSQSTYDEEILERAHMKKCTPCKTLVDTESKLRANDDLVSDPTLYRSLSGTIDHGLQLHVSSTSQLTIYTDTDWAGCPVTLSRSSAETEYRGVANVVAETAWVCNLLRELYVPLFTVTLVYFDNVSVVYLSNNRIQHQHTKHIEIDIHFIFDLWLLGKFMFFMFIRGFTMLISLPKAF
ncbi:ribonuclease H-like domain-containing protein [Tanacetum coccineum]